VSVDRPDGDGTTLVLSLHGVGPVPEHAGPEERPFWCTEAAFTALLDEVVPASVDAGVPIRLTFDDGNDSDVRVALPLLADRRLRADFFVCAGRLGRPGYLDEASVRELDDAGMGIGSHGWDHVDWRRVDGAARQRELVEARSRLSAVVGRAVDDVAIPFGSYDRGVLAGLRRSGVHTAYTSDGGLADGHGWLPTRETCTAAWVPPTLHDVARGGPPQQRLRNAAARLVKRLR
jgi:peptidoglycan/xylan/chitin deacetylase (PgdA/CDA1 family)